MGLKAMLTVDLNRTTEDQRNVFNQQMESLKWKKIKTLTTIWQASFQDGVSEEDAIAEAKRDVAKAAGAARISSYDGGVMMGPNFPTVWQQR